MPIFNKDIFSNNNVQLWSITETLDELGYFFDKDDEIKDIISKIKNDSKKLQFLASRLLVEKEFGNWRTIKNKEGKPFPIDKKSEISITHDKGIAGLIKNNTPCGIDIQEVSNKVLRVKEKFVNDDDIFSSSNVLEELTILWCAKETLYKINGVPEIFFKEHMIIEKTEENDIIIGKIIHPNYFANYKMKIHFIKNYCLVYTL